MVQALVLRIFRCSFRILKVKNFSPERLTPPNEGSIAPIYTKNIHNLTSAIVNKSLEFQND